MRFHTANLPFDLRLQKIRIILELAKNVHQSKEKVYFCKNIFYGQKETRHSIFSIVLH